MLHIQTYYNSNFPLLKYATNVPCFMQVCAALKGHFGGQTWVAPFPPSGSVGDGGVVDSEPKENDKFGMFSLLMIPGTGEDPPEDSGIPPGPPPAVADPA